MSVEQSLEESMIATLEAMEQEDEEESDEEIEEPEEVAPEGEETEETAPDDTTTVDEEPAPEPKAAKPEKQPKQPKEPAEPPLEPALELPPTGWDAESKAKYKDLPAWMKRISHKREMDMLKGVDQLKRQLQAVDPINKAAEPYKAFLNSKGLSLDNVVGNSLNLAYSLATGSAEQKQSIILGIARQYGVDLANIPKPDPNTQQYQQHLQPVVSRLERAEQELQQRKQAEEQYKFQQAAQLVQQFETAVDENGERKYPYLDVPGVREEMAALYDAGRGTTLEAAYESAVWSIPDTRQLMLQKQLAAQQAKRQAEAKERAARAKRSQSVNLDKRGQHDSSSRKPTGSLDDTLNETFDRLAS